MSDREPIELNIAVFCDYANVALSGDSDFSPLALFRDLDRGPFGEPVQLQKGEPSGGCIVVGVGDGA